MRGRMNRVGCMRCLGRFGGLGCLGGYGRAWQAARRVAGVVLLAGLLTVLPATSPARADEHRVNTQGAGADATVVARQSTDLPAVATRIATLDDLSTEIVLSLGIAPVAVANLEGYRRYVGIGASLLQNAVSLGSPQQPDLEALLRLRPDVIVGVAYLHLPLFERLRQLAPTLVFQVSLAPGAQDGVAIGAAMLLALGDLTARRDKAQAVLADSRAAIARTRTEIAARGLAGRPMVAFYPLSREGTFIVSNRQSMVASLMDRLGVTNPWRLESGYALHRRIGLRELAARPDLTALFVGGQEDAPMFKTPVWRALPAARAGRVAFLPLPYWTFGGPVSAARLATQIGDAVRAMPGAGP